MDGELDPQQAELLRHLAGPETAAQLAIRFGVPTPAIRRRMRALYHHLGTGERSEAVAVAVARGLIPDPAPVVPTNPRARRHPAR